jgi:hypothetical protein
MSAGEAFEPGEFLATARAAGLMHAVTPGGRPAALDLALKWVQFMSDQGYCLGYEIDRSERLVYLKAWECGDDEPTWEDVRAVAKPALTYRFELSASARQYCDAVHYELVQLGYSEADALSLMNEEHSRLPWLAKETVDAIADELPSWWAQALHLARREP